MGWDGMDGRGLMDQKGWDGMNEWNGMGRNGMPLVEVRQVGIGWGGIEWDGK